jgi:hypothetical protein
MLLLSTAAEIPAEGAIDLWRWKLLHQPSRVKSGALVIGTCF